MGKKMDNRFSSQGRGGEGEKKEEEGSKQGGKEEGKEKERR